MDGIHTLFSDIVSRLVACHPSFSYSRYSLPFSFILMAHKKSSCATSNGLEGPSLLGLLVFLTLPPRGGPLEVPTEGQGYMGSLWHSLATSSDLCILRQDYNVPKCIVFKVPLPDERAKDPEVFSYKVTLFPFMFSKGLPLPFYLPV